MIEFYLFSRGGYDKGFEEFFKYFRNYFFFYSNTTVLWIFEDIVFIAVCLIIFGRVVEMFFAFLILGIFLFIIFIVLL